MVIELRGVPEFGLKEYAGFQNQSAAGVRFEFTSMISGQNCKTRSSVVTLLDPF